MDLRWHDVEIYQNRRWQRRRLYASRVGSFLIGEGLFYSARFWREVGEGGSWTVLKKPNITLGPFKKSELGMAQELADQHGLRVRKKGSQWYVK
jgi:hypothetical protein